MTSFTNNRKGCGFTPKPANQNGSDPAPGSAINDNLYMNKKTLTEDKTHDNYLYQLLRILFYKNYYLFIVYVQIGGTSEPVLHISPSNRRLSLLTTIQLTISTLWGWVSISSPYP